MFNPLKDSRGALALCLLSALCLAGTRAALADEGGRSAVAKNVQGEVLQKEASSDWKELSQGEILSESQAVKTGPSGSATLQFEGKSKARVDVRPNSLLELSKLRTQGSGDRTEIYVSLGSILVKSDKLTEGSDFDVRTPKQIVGIRGTEFEVKVD